MPLPGEPSPALRAPDWQVAVAPHPGADVVVADEHRQAGDAERHGQSLVVVPCDDGDHEAGECHECRWEHEAEGHWTPIGLVVHDASFRRRYMNLIIIANLSNIVK